jgi:AraC-like DNA-binding protein
MDFEYLFLVLSYSVSIFSSIFCFVLIALKLGYNVLDHFTKRLSIVLMIFYVVSLMYFTTICIDVFDLQENNWYRIVNFQSVILIPVLLYHITFKLSRLQKSDTFKYYHYLICGLVGLGYFIYSEYFSEPTVLAQGNTKDELFFDKGRIILRIIYNIVYLVLAFYRIYQYRKNIKNYSSDDSQNSLRWIYNIQIIVLLLFPAPILFHIIEDVKISLIIGQLMPNFIYMLLNIVLCYNIFTQNFALVYEDIIEADDSVEKTSTQTSKDIYIDKDFFEDYFFTEKPYLNPQLKITDLLADLRTNRSYLSSFINNTYNMNFSQFVNQCRFKEYLEYKKSVSLPRENDGEIIVASGFRSYDSFKRTENYYNKNKQLINN